MEIQRNGHENKMCPQGRVGGGEKNKKAWT